MKREILSNGIVIISHNKPNDYTARLVVASRFGSIYEYMPGLAHLLEHCILSANTDKLNSNKISENIDFLGGRKNGKTGYKSLRLFGSTHNVNFNRFADVFTSLVLRPKFINSTFEKDKKIVLNELKGNIDDINRHLYYLLLSGLFHNPPFKTSISTKIKVLKHISLNDIRNSYKIFFAPKNIVVGLVGNYKESTYQNIKKRLININNNYRPIPIIPRIKNKPFCKKNVEKRSGLKQVYIATGVKTCSVENVDLPSLFIISSLLTQGSSSRLYRELRQKRGLIYSVGSRNNIGKEFGFFYIKTRTEKYKGKETLKIIRNELTNLKNKKIDESELLRAKNKILSYRKAIYDIPLEGSLKMIEDEIIFGNFFRERKLISRIKKVNSSDIKIIANKYFQDSNFSTAIIRPK